MASSAARTITIFGGNGFIGRELVRALSRSPTASTLQIRLASRHPPSASRLSSLAPGLSQVTGVPCDLRDTHQVTEALRGATHVVNCVGILYETPSKGLTFRAIQETGPANIASALSSNAGHTVKRAVHLSAIGADQHSPSEYARTKAAGEAAMLDIKDGCHLTILRPSIVFGPEDAFFNRFDQLARIMPFLPLVGGGKTRFQPVHVENVAQAICKCLDEQPTGESGMMYHLGGASILTFKELMQLTLAASGRRRLLLPIPFPVANMQGTLFETIHRLVPSVPPMLTRDQVQLLKRDNVVPTGAKTLKDLGIEAKPCTLNTVSYLG